MAIRFATHPLEVAVIERIADRAVAVAAEAGVDYPKGNIIMDIEATHCNGCPLALLALLDADSADFGHDVFGIRRHLDRTTGKLTNLFRPRYAQPSRGRHGVR